MSSDKQMAAEMKRKGGPSTSGMSSSKRMRGSEGAKIRAASGFPSGCSVWVWGEGDFGQLGLGVDRLDARMRPTPVEEKGAAIARSVAAGGMHTVTVSPGGDVWTWGVNDEKALGREADAEGGADPGQIAGTEGVVAVSAGDSHTLLLLRDGSVWGCGTYREDGPMGFLPGVRIQEKVCKVFDVAASGDSIIKIGSGTDHAVALSAEGKVWTWGYGGHGQLGRVGKRFSTEERKLAAFLVPGQVRIPRSAGKVVDIFVGAYHTFALTEKDRVYAFGLNNYGQLGLTSDKGILFAPLLIKALSGKGIKSIACGQHHTLAIVAVEKKNKLLSFGRAAFGRLGRDVSALLVGGDAAVSELGEVELPEEPVECTAGLAVSGALLRSGEYYSWGCGSNFLLAKGDDEDDEERPRKVKETKRWNGHKVMKVVYGGQHAVMLCMAKD